MITRIHAYNLLKSKKSVLLLGPRQVGKSTLIKSLKPDLSLNLSTQDEFLDHAANAGLLKQLIETHRPKSIFIDEVQRLPSLLNSVQALIDDDKSLKFYLTGSSARKLKKGRANLLPGRIFNYQMGPLVAKELDYKIETAKILSYGSLPEVYLENDSKQVKKLLRSYAGAYLKEEIQAEALTRNLESFSRFFSQVASEVGNFIDYSKLSKKTKISRHACARYFEVLEDTLVGYRVFPFSPLVDEADLIKHPKFYFFDGGVYNGLIGNFTPSVDRSGLLAEQLVYTQVMHSAHAQDLMFKASTYRTRGGAEVDFIFELDQEVVAIEVKNSEHLITDDVAHLKNFKKTYGKRCSLFLAHMGTKKNKLDGIWCLPWQSVLKEMGI